MDEFNIWDLERVNVKVNKKFFNKLVREIDSKFKSRRDFYNQTFDSKFLPFSTFRNFLKISHASNFFIPLEFYLKIVEELDISKEELQSNVTSYKTAGGVNFIEKPILPIKITPVFDMLFAHHIGDGTVINPKKGRLPYFGYKQFNEFYRIAYVKKLESVFGNINYFKKNYFLSSKNPYSPPVISTSFFKYYDYNVYDFLSDRARIPDIIFQDKDRMLAVLIAFIIDEGHIDSTLINIRVKNKGLIEDLKRICDILEYASKIAYRKNYEGSIDTLYIFRDGMERLYRDYINLNKKYSVIDLGIKGEKIRKSFEIIHRSIQNIEGNTDLIFNILKKEQLSVNQLAVRINMTRQGIRYHIHNLLKRGKIKLIDNKSLNWIYGV